MNITRTFCWVGLMAFTHLALASYPDTKPYAVKTFPAKFINRLNVQIEGGGGSVFFVGTSKTANQISVEIYVENNHWQVPLSDEERAQRLNNFVVTVALDPVTPTALLARVAQTKADWREGLNISFRIVVPAAIDTYAKTSGGNVEFTDWQGGRHQAQTSGGNLQLNSFSGNLVGESSGGNINLDDSSGELTLRSSGGTIWLGSIRGNVDVVSGGGNLQGDIAWLDNHVAINTGSGNVQLRLPLKQGLDLDLRGRKVSIPLTNFVGESSTERVLGRLNGGGVRVQVDGGSSGTIQIAR
ncbi:DUF4097 family beta strand repeat-containing protein [Fibrella aquatilis]|uniref:DUF4097 family beta strand repeat protein n=1 Tax=Fibrella aquatilis TaxID=2817059 RepID=A0A939G3H5_9BACT|nr:DUF4097 family beta strand repeat-containing protein [Fibrella aquatilis]MBO0931677.1 DUF4097 family beta strand repeat protein [Fibrella aquatilis]